MPAMELIFEKNWIYACHESELANNHDFVNLRAGRQSMIITRIATYSAAAKSP